MSKQIFLLAAMFVCAATAAFAYPGVSYPAMAVGYGNSYGAGYTAYGYGAYGGYATYGGYRITNPSPVSYAGYGLYDSRLPRGHYSAYTDRYTNAWGYPQPQVWYGESRSDALPPRGYPNLNVVHRG